MAFVVVNSNAHRAMELPLAAWLDHHHWRLTLLEPAANNFFSVTSSHESASTLPTPFKVVFKIDNRSVCMFFDTGDGVQVIFEAIQRLVARV